MATDSGLLEILRRKAYLQAGGVDKQPATMAEQLNNIFGTINSGVQNYQAIQKNVLEQEMAQLAIDKAGRDAQIVSKGILPGDITPQGASSFVGSPNTQAFIDAIKNKNAPKMNWEPTDVQPMNRTRGEVKADADIDYTNAQADYLRNGGKSKTYQSLLPAIKSGYASEEFVRRVFPELPEGADVSIGELQQRTGIYKVELPKQLPNEQIDKITQMRTAVSGTESIKKQFFDLLAGGKSPVDPIGGRWESLKGTIGIQGDEAITKFQTDVVAQLNTYLNSISGAAITEQEAKRLMKRLPGVGMNNDQFLGRMDSFQSELDRALGARVQTLKDANFKIGDLERLIPKKEKTDTSKTDKITLPPAGAQLKIKAAKGQPVTFENGESWAYQNGELVKVN